MITDTFRQTLAQVREAIDSDGEWRIFNSIPEGVSRRPELDAPEEYLDFLLAADGAIMGSIVILDKKFAEKSQALISPGMVEIPEDPADWFVVGKINENAVLANRRDGSIWTYPDMLTPWWESCRFERVADHLAGFVSEYGLGPGYLRITGAEESDQWWQLLRQLGYA
ncbi:hypothetical protein [Streptomyces murinus]|uniref:Knr4/Smi1-like domain-containing protein n=1 Tax=Streptomyces murinus TaxID=33900 RepID=A0A7W3NTH3_STRMR|nr:hypothetical protein [Streptomyces murinus]MBA9056438.1 hypothetical protein [Streptomyces murinus]UWW90906.1 hypothetical protein GO605_08590 [Streptomyces murinus]